MKLRYFLLTVADLQYMNRLAAVREQPYTEAEAFDGVTYALL